MKAYEIKPIESLNTEIEIPGNKYVANRLLIICALANGKSILKNVPNNQDIDNAIIAIKKFGIDVNKINNDIHIKGKNGSLDLPNEEINIGESGTFMRYIAGFASLCGNDVKITGENKIKERPIKELLDALKLIGIESKSLNDGFPPFIVNGKNFEGGKIKLPGNISSQYISSVLLISPYAKKDIEIEVTTPQVSKNYIDLTIYYMEKFGVEVQRKDYSYYKVKCGQKYDAKDFTIPSDWASSSYFFAAASILPGAVKVRNLDMKSPQGESQFPDLLLKMGCMYRRNHKWLQITGLGHLNGIDVDMSHMPDVVQTLAIVAAFSKGKTSIRNIEHLKYKESDRVKDTVNELSKLGVDVKTDGKNIEIIGKEVKGAIIDSHNDHRMAMSFAIAGLKVSGIKILNPDCVVKSFPHFWDILRKIGVEVKEIDI